MNELENTSNILAGWNDYLMGAPIAVVVFLFCVGVGLLLLWVPFVDNKRVPAVVFFCGIVLFMLTAVRGDLEMRIWLGRNFMLGSIIGVIANSLTKWAAKKLSAFAGTDDDKTPPPANP
jgi:hypothetical protein